VKSRFSKLVSILVLVLILASTSIVAAQADPIIYVDPADQTITQYTSTSVDIWVSGVENFYGTQFELNFDDTILEGLDVVEGEAFTAFPDEYQVAQNEIVSGTVKFAATLLRVPKAGPLQGNLHLATITFGGLAEGTSDLVLDGVKLSNSYGQPIAYTIEDGSITVGCEAGILGSAHLEGRDDHSGVLVTLEGAAVLTTTTDISGTYVFEDLATGLYTVTLGHDGYLSVVTEVQVSGCELVELCTFHMIAGDLNNDEIIDVADLALCAANFGGTGPDGDVNDDGVVNIYDLVLIGKNFKISGPQQGACG
jgi:hypothetical protein